MKNLSKESIIEAIHKINANPHLLKGRESFLYDLVHNGKKYPPILVISEANKILGGEEIMLKDFGNNAKNAFRKLTEHGFKIVKKNGNSNKVWFVCQGSSFNDENKFIWAPKLDKKGNPKFYWENMNKVRKGDIIFNYSKGVRGVSIAVSDCYEAENPWEQTPWEKKGYKVDLDFTEFETPIDTNKLKKRKSALDIALYKISNKPFNSEGGVNQGFLYEFTPEAGKIILDIYGKPTGNDVIDGFFNMIDASEDPQEPFISEPVSFKFMEFIRSLADSGLLFSEQLIVRFIASLITKPFVILTGLSGSGKTKLAQAFVQWISKDEKQYCIVPVGADWTNREPLLGYPNALNPEEYVKPDNGVLDLLMRAKVNTELPYFLILDEMNLSHVERYFADFLSVMESKGDIPLYAEGTVNNGVPAKLQLPDNLFIIGTVNIDETTNMFSPKVLDRANTIEFRINKQDMELFLGEVKQLDMKALKAKGADMASSFLSMSRNNLAASNNTKDINVTLLHFFGELKKTGAEFGFRSASEIFRLISQLSALDDSLLTKDKVDIAIMQKLLPKLHGSRRKLCPVLEKLGEFCINGNTKIVNVFEQEDFDFDNNPNVIYKLSLEKISRMYKCAVDNGFASFAEA